MSRAAGEDMSAPGSRFPTSHQPDGVEFRLLEGQPEYARKGPRP
ncbi:hypothetical protein AB0K16_19815 [Nonomuraea jabiensis]